MFEAQWRSVDGLIPPVFDDALPEWGQPDYAETIDALACADPGEGPSLEQLVTVGESSVLASIDPRRLGEDARLELCVAAHRREAQLAGVKARAVAVFAGPFPADEHSEAAFAWCEISAALKLSEGHARSYTDEARHLVADLPATLAAAIDRGLAWAKVRTVVTATMGLTPEQCAAVEARVLPKAAGRSPSAHRDMVDRWVRKTAPDVWKNRREQKLRDTALIRLHHGDGVADVIAENIDSAQADELWTAADTWARREKQQGNARTLDQLRVDALVQFARDYLAGVPIDSHNATSTTTPHPPTRAGSPATVNVVIALPDLVCGTGAGMLAATRQPLPADAVADLLKQGAGIRFVLADDNGDLVGFSPDRHDPDTILQTFVCLRDLTVRTPSGSAAAASGQDLDHIDPHGPTTAHNLHPPSRGWHRAKTFGHWTVTANPDRTITWTSTRTGRSYTTHPFNYRDGP